MVVPEKKKEKEDENKPPLRAQIFRNHLIVIQPAEKSKQQKMNEQEKITNRPKSNSSLQRLQAPIAKKKKSCLANGTRQEFNSPVSKIQKTPSPPAQDEAPKNKKSSFCWTFCVLTKISLLINYYFDLLFANYKAVIGYCVFFKLYPVVIIYKYIFTQKCNYKK